MEKLIINFLTCFTVVLRQQNLKKILKCYLTFFHAHRDIFFLKKVGILPKLLTIFHRKKQWY